MTTPEEIAARREAFEDDPDNVRPDYPASAGLVEATKDAATLRGERDALRAEVERLRADWRKVTRTLGYGDGITEPQIDADNFIRLMEETARDANEWRETQLWRGDCHMAGHPDDEDCFEHDPSLRLEKAEAIVARVEALATKWQSAEQWDGNPARITRGFGETLSLVIDGEVAS